eukprot:4224947-Prymnesium_polylepis.1
MSPSGHTVHTDTSSTGTALRRPGAGECTFISPHLPAHVSGTAGVHLIKEKSVHLRCGRACSPNAHLPPHPSLKQLLPRRK